MRMRLSEECDLCVSLSLSLGELNYVIDFFRSVLFVVLFVTPSHLNKNNALFCFYISLSLSRFVITRPSDIQPKKKICKEENLFIYLFFYNF